MKTYIRRQQHKTFKHQDIKQKKTGQSIKFVFFWRGPFQVVEKVTYVLLKINCGRNGTLSVIHIDWVRKVRPQNLPREIERDK